MFLDHFCSNWLIKLFCYSVAQIKLFYAFLKSNSLMAELIEEKLLSYQPILLKKAQNDLKSRKAKQAVVEAKKIQSLSTETYSFMQLSNMSQAFIQTVILFLVFTNSIAVSITNILPHGLSALLFSVWMD